MEVLFKPFSCELGCLTQEKVEQLSHVNEVITQYSPEGQSGHDAPVSQTTHPSVPLTAEVEAVAVLDKDVLPVSVDVVVILFDPYELT